MSKLTHNVLHHFAGVATNPFLSTQSLSERHIENAHAARWPGFVSSLGYHIGYTFIIWPDGTVKQYRKIGEEGAHTKGYNSRSVGICLAGNFTPTVDVPTAEQKKALKDLLQVLTTNSRTLINQYGYKIDQDAILSLSEANIVPHRLLAPKGYTECYGALLSDTWAKELLIRTEEITETERQTKLESIKQTLIQIALQIKELLRSKTLGRVDWRDDEEVSYELETN